MPEEDDNIEEDKNIIRTSLNERNTTGLGGRANSNQDHFSSIPGKEIDKKVVMLDEGKKETRNSKIFIETSEEQDARIR